MRQCGGNVAVRILPIEKRGEKSDRKHIMRPRELVAQLERDGQDRGPARDLLTQFEELQVLHVTDPDRLIAELARAGEN